MGRHACKHRDMLVDWVPCGGNSVQILIADTFTVPTVPKVARLAPHKPEIAPGEVGALILAENADLSPLLRQAVVR